LAAEYLGFLGLSGVETFIDFAIINYIKNSKNDLENAQE